MLAELEEEGLAKFHLSWTVRYRGFVGARVAQTIASNVKAAFERETSLSLMPAAFKQRSRLRISREESNDRELIFFDRGQCLISVKSWYHGGSDTERGVDIIEWEDRKLEYGGGR